MALVYTSFLRLSDNVAGTNDIFLNITAWQENEPQWLGGRERSVDGTLLTTEHDYRWSGRGTAEFMLGSELQAFERFISLEWDSNGIRDRGKLPRKCSVISSGEHSVLRRASGVGFDVYVYMGAKTPFTYVISGSPNQTVATGWSVEFTLEEA